MLVAYVAVGDALSLREHILRLYPGRNNTGSIQIFTYRLIRARVVENAFGILAARWRVYHSRIALHPIDVNHIVEATTVFHNMLQSQTTPARITSLLEDSLELKDAEGLGFLAYVGNGLVRGQTSFVNNSGSTS